MTPWQHLGTRMLFGWGSGTTHVFQQCLGGWVGFWWSQIRLADFQVPKFQGFKFQRSKFQRSRFQNSKFQNVQRSKLGSRTCCQRDFHRTFGVENVLPNHTGGGGVCLWVFGWQGIAHTGGRGGFRVGKASGEPVGGVCSCGGNLRKCQKQTRLGVFRCRKSAN